MRHIGEDPPPPRRLRRRRRFSWLPWRRPPPATDSRIIPFPGRAAVATPALRSDRPPSGPGLGAVLGAGAAVLALLVVAAVVYRAAVVAESRRPHVDRTSGGPYSLLAPRATGRGDGVARFHTAMDRGRFGLSYRACTAPLRLHVAVAGYPNDGTTLTVPAGTGTVTYEVDADTDLVVAVLLPRGATCAGWQVSANGGS